MEYTLKNTHIWPWEAALELGKTIRTELVGDWKWGTCHRRVFEFSGQLFAVSYRLSEAGVCMDWDPKIYKVEARKEAVIKYIILED